MDLRTWNYVGKKGVKPGKKLTVYVRENAPTSTKLEIKPETKNEQNIASNSNNDAKLVAENASTKTAEFIWHKVKKGDTFYKIGMLYHVLPADIKSLNSLDQKATLSIGQLLKIKEK
jgi:LysM repeat protein